MHHVLGVAGIEKVELNVVGLRAGVDAEAELVRNIAALVDSIGVGPGLEVGAVGSAGGGRAGTLVDDKGDKVEDLLAVGQALLDLQVADVDVDGGLVVGQAAGAGSGHEGGGEREDGEGLHFEGWGWFVLGGGKRGVV